MFGRRKEGEGRPIVPLALPAADLDEARAMIAQLHSASWDAIADLSRRYDDAWDDMAWSAKMLPSEPDERLVREATALADEAMAVVQWRTSEIGEVDPTYAWVNGFGSLLRAIHEAVFAVAARSCLS